MTGGKWWVPRTVLCAISCLCCDKKLRQIETKRRANAQLWEGKKYGEVTQNPTFISEWWCCPQVLVERSTLILEDAGPSSLGFKLF